jgi:hypothetical protein
VRGHVVDEQRGALAVLRNRREEAEQLAVEGAHAVDLQRDRVRLVGQPAQDHRRQVAAVDRQAGLARQRRRVAVGQMSGLCPYPYKRAALSAIRPTVDTDKVTIKIFVISGLHGRLLVGTAPA